MNPIIKLSDNAAIRIKEIMSNAEKNSLGVRVSVKTVVAQVCLMSWNILKKLTPMTKL